MCHMKTDCNMIRGLCQKCFTSNVELKLKKGEALCDKCSDSEG